MSLTYRLFSTHHRTFVHFSNPNFKDPYHSAHLLSQFDTHFRIPGTDHVLSSVKFKSICSKCTPPRAFESDRAVGTDYATNSFDLDSFLSISELLCLASSAVVSIGLFISLTFSSLKKPGLMWVGNRVYEWQFVILASGIVIGAIVRRRQWRRVCLGFAKAKSKSDVDLFERIEKLEEGIRNLKVISQALSRKLEKLGIRFRVTRNAIREPIVETAALGQKNYEATRALAVQEEVLEKELGEVQKVLLAMQEQQQKQLELILAIAGAGKFREDKGRDGLHRDPKKGETSSEEKASAANRMQALALEKESEDSRMT